MKTLIQIAKNYWFLPIMILIIVLCNLFVFRMVMTFGESMVPTIQNGDMVLTMIKHKPEDIHRYDVVVFKHEGRYLIKRVIGLPGETIQIINNIILINNQPVKDPIDIEMKDYGLLNEPYQIQSNEFICLGDNRNHSGDSREFGGVMMEDILGVGKMILFPPKSLTTT